MRSSISVFTPFKRGISTLFQAWKLHFGALFCFIMHGLKRRQTARKSTSQMWRKSHRVSKSHENAAKAPQITIKVD